MSALNRQSHATNTQPLWLSAGNAIATGSIAAPEFDLVLKNGTPVGARITGDGTADGYMYLQGTQIKMGQLNQGATNTTLTTSAPGSNLDSLVVGGSVSVNKLNIATGGAGATCGTGTIAIGATNVVISTTAITASSKVFFSFVGSPSAGPGAGPSQGNLILNSGLTVPGTSFRVDHTDATGVSTAVSNVACTFNWMIIN